MKKLRLLLITACLSGISCKKCESPAGNAQLTGIDFRKCASPYCGGWFLKIEEDTLRFFQVPAKTDIDLNSELDFPIPVHVEWKKYNNEWKDIEDLIFVEELWKR